MDALADKAGAGQHRDIARLHRTLAIKPRRIGIGNIVPGRLHAKLRGIQTRNTRIYDA